jgi:hypothetical protein
MSVTSDNDSRTSHKNISPGEIAQFIQYRITTATIIIHEDHSTKFHP